MDTTAGGVAQKEDDEQGIDAQDIFDRVGCTETFLLRFHCRNQYLQTWSFDICSLAVCIENTGVPSTLFLGICLP